MRAEGDGARAARQMGSKGDGAEPAHAVAEGDDFLRTITRQNILQRRTDRRESTVIPARGFLNDKIGAVGQARERLAKLLDLQAAQAGGDAGKSHHGDLAVTPQVRDNELRIVGQCGHRRPPPFRAA